MSGESQDRVIIHLRMHIKAHSYDERPTPGPIGRDGLRAVSGAVIYTHTRRLTDYVKMLTTPAVHVAIPRNASRKLDSKTATPGFTGLFAAAAIMIQISPPRNATPARRKNNKSIIDLYLHDQPTSTVSRLDSSEGEWRRQRDVDV